jgi:hypothetical protein
MKKLNHLLPELGRIFAYDLKRFENLWFTQFDTLVDYATAFEKLIYIIGMGNPDLEKKAVEIVEEFIVSRQNEEWKSPSWLVHELRRVVGEGLNRTHAKLQSLIPQLVRKIAEDSRYMEVFLPFDEIVSDYSHIIGYIVEIFSYPDTEAVSEALEALEAFLQGKESREWLKYSLGAIVSRFNDFKEAQP